MNDLNFFNQKKKKKKPKKVFDNDVEEGLKVSHCETSTSLVFPVTFGLCVSVWYRNFTSEYLVLVLPLLSHPFLFLTTFALTLLVVSLNFTSRRSKSGAEN